MKKVLFYINGIAGGGAERVITNLANGFEEKGYESIMVTSFVRPQNEYPLNKGVKRISIEQEEIKQTFLKRNYSRIVALRKICKTEKPDIIVSFMAEPNYRSLIATTGLGIKRVISVRTDPVREYAGKIGYFLSRHLLTKADGCVFQTEDARAWFPEKLQKKSTIIFNMVKPAFYRAPAPTPNKKIVSCSRIVEKKNLGMLINAFEKIYQDDPEVELLIYGDGPYMERLLEIVNKSPAKRHIYIKGQSDDIPKALSECSIFVLSSNFEGAPNSLMEAMAVGLACISTDCPCGGPRMLIDNSTNGLLIDVGDVEGLANAMRKLLSNDELRSQYGEAAKKRAEAFKPDVVLDKWEKYLAAISEK